MTKIQRKLYALVAPSKHIQHKQYIPWIIPGDLVCCSCTCSFCLFKFCRQIFNVASQPTVARHSIRTIVIVSTCWNWLREIEKPKLKKHTKKNNSHQIETSLGLTGTMRLNATPLQGITPRSPTKSCITDIFIRYVCKRKFAPVSLWRIAQCPAIANMTIGFAFVVCPAGAVLSFRTVCRRIVPGCAAKVIVRVGFLGTDGRQCYQEKDQCLKVQGAGACH